MWVTRWWRELIRDVILTLSGLGVIGSQVIAEHPNLGLLGTGLALTAPATYAKLKDLASPAGSSGSSSPPPGPPSSPATPGRTGD